MFWDPQKAYESVFWYFLIVSVCVCVCVCLFVFVCVPSIYKSLSVYVFLFSSRLLEFLSLEEEAATGAARCRRLYLLITA